MVKAPSPPDCVILLHGLARTKLSMSRLQQSLQESGYDVVNINYPSRHLAIDELADTVIDTCLSLCREKNVHKIHFVTHSLGGILVRCYVQKHDIPELSRVVMLGPPNQGSEAVDKLKHLSFFNWINGPAGAQLGTAEHDLPKSLGSVNFELGVIAGKRSLNLLLSRLLPGMNDGKVSVESTKIEGMIDFLTLPTTHSFMMRNPETIRQTLHFLQYGRFDHTV